MAILNTLAKPDARPLYIQVKDILVKRIHTGQWAPGRAIPSEMNLAAELGVSQGTVRKALNSLADTSLVERRQGKGTYVVEHTSNQVLFKFFRIYENNGKIVSPSSSKAIIKIKPATKKISNTLNLSDTDKIIELYRIRTYQEKPIILETIFLPLDMFFGIQDERQLPNTLYDYFQKKFSITISSVQENLTPVIATASQAKALMIEEKAPLLLIDRVAHDIEQRPIEKRISYCFMDGLKYVSKLS